MASSGHFSIISQKYLSFISHLFLLVISLIISQLFCDYFLYSIIARDPQIIKMAVVDCPAFHRSLNEHQLLRSYFDEGYTYKDITDYMETKHRILLSLQGKVRP